MPVPQPNKLSLLGDAIEYVRELERQVDELKSTAKSVEVSVEKGMAVLKISCAWRDGLLIDILQKMIDLRLEVVDAHARVSDDVLHATLKTKVRGT